MNEKSVREIMNHLMKQQIVSKIRGSLAGKSEKVYIIGSFLNENWDSHQSDIDLVCVDFSFVYFPYYVNLGDIKNALGKLPFRFDIFLYTWNQFYTRFKEDSRFKEWITRGIVI